MVFLPRTRVSVLSCKKSVTAFYIHTQNDEPGLKRYYSPQMALISRNRKKKG